MAFPLRLCLAGALLAANLACAADLITFWDARPRHGVNIMNRQVPDAALFRAALALLVVALVMPLMTVSTAGMTREATLLSGPRGMGASGLWPLEIMVLFTTAAAPAGMA